MPTVFFAVVLSIAPGLYAWASSRKLVERRDDPLLPEYLLARKQRVTAWIATVLGIGIVLMRPYLVYVLFASILGVLAGGFPARKKIFAETWSLAAYLSHQLRFWVGMLLPVLFVASIPMAMRVTGEHRLAAGIGVGALALLCAAFSSVLFARFVLARTLARPELDTAFESILVKARCPRPALLEADARGGTWVNAFAVPSIGTPSVLFTKGLIDALEPRETTAIFAHEVAHLEHHSRRRQALALLLMVVLAGLPILIWGGPWSEHVDGFEWAWPVALLFSLAVRARRLRAHEAESDLRAVELCGDPESLIAALTKIHVLMHVPRRWSEHHESQSSHPSLSRRIQAIRRAHVGQERAIRPATFLSGDASGRAVVLDAEKLHLLTGVPAQPVEILAEAEERRSVRYSDLVELRLVGEPRQLLFKDTSGRTTRVSIREEDVSQLSSLLDRIDVEIQYRPALPKGRIASLIVALVALAPLGIWTVVLLGMMAAAVPSRAALAAAGAGALVSGVGYVLRIGGEPAWSLATLGAASAVCIALATKRLRLGEAESARVVSLALAVPAICVLARLATAASVFVSPLPVMKLHLWARDSLGVVGGLAAIAAALATVPSIRPRLGGILVASLSAGVLLLGSTGFGWRYGGDVFARIAPQLDVVAVGLEKTREVPFDGVVQDLTLSPGGSHFSALVSTDQGDLYLVETPNGVERVDALALDFIDDERVAVVTLENERPVLSFPSFSIALPWLQSLDLTVDARSDGWQLRGIDPENYDTVVLRGHLSAASFDELRFRSEEDGVGVVGPVSYEGSAIHYDYATAEWTSATMLRVATALDPSDLSTRVSLRREEGGVEPIGTTLLDAYCFLPSMSDSGFVCSAHYGGRTSLFTFDPEQQDLVPIGSLSGFYQLDDPVRDGRLVLGAWHEAPILVDLETNQALRPSLGGGRILAWRKDVLATAETDDLRSTVTIYRLAEPPP
ncbi:MAG TPA: M48 family metalloprotease [Vicinamibacteria bacterium]|nr:M48 family metalloprotease [Vicinamibacteria bacterium]